MSRSTGSIDRRDVRRTTTLRTLLSSTTRYDFVLAAIPLCFLASLLATAASPLSLHQTVAAASLLGALALVDALFVNPPRPGR
jgi:small-conductance mechanosensitive channel